MKIKKSVFYFFLLSYAILFSQKNDEVLFTIDDAPIYVSEFMRVYNKNLNIVQDEEQKDLNNYLELFINYKLKIKQAYDLGLDTLPNYVKELKTYKQQLIEPYLKDDGVVENLVKEAYERSLEEVKASHILIKLNPNNPSDTLTIYNKIIEARERIINGEDFSKVAKQYSQDPSAAMNGGDLGYFSVFGMVYPFENAAYNTKIGEVSMPFKTKFGYHILKVFDKRKAKGEIEAAHIMLKKETNNAEQKINDIYNKLLNGDDFGYLAKTQSEDTYSAKKNGSLGKFGSGRMIKSFEDVAYSLKNEGDISKPFKTRFGWHIIKLIKKYPIKSFDELKNELNQKIKRGDRSKIIKSSIIKKLKDKYEIKENNEVINSFRKKDWLFSLGNTPNVVMTINDEEVTKNDLGNYLGKRVLNDNLLSLFKDRQILEYYKNHLQDTNKEFANTLQEYKEGLLLFEILQSRIWDKSKDSLGLQEYYASHKNEFLLPKRFEGSIASSTSKKMAKSVRKYLEKGMQIDSITSKLNSDKQVNVIFKNGVFDKKSELIPANYKFIKGISKIFKINDDYIVISTRSILPEKQQKLEEIKGKVINNYQEYLEKKWVEELRNKYKVIKNEEVLKSLNK